MSRVGAAQQHHTSQSVVACTVAVLSPPCFSRAISPKASPAPRVATSLQYLKMSDACSSQQYAVHLKYANIQG